MAPAFGQSMVAPLAQPIIQRVVQPVPVYHPVLRQVPVPVIRPVPVPVVYHHHHWPVHIHHNPVQPVAAPLPHYTTFSYHPYSYGKSDVPHHKKDTIHIHDYGVPAHGHVGHANGNSHVVTHHGYATRHADCPNHCGTCQPPNCPSDCKPHCVAIIHHQHHRPHHVFVNHQHHHNIAQTHFHNHHWPVHHHDVYHNRPYLPHRHIGYPVLTYPPYHHHGRRSANDYQRQTVPHYKVYQHVKHWHPPCIHHSHTCHHHHHPMTLYHDHHHPTKVLHHHHYRPYPVYHHHEHIKPVIYHHLKPYPIHHHHTHHIHDTWHHDTHHHSVSPPLPYPIPVTIPTPIEVPVPVSSTLPIPVLPPSRDSSPVPVMLPWTPNYGAASHNIMGRSNVPHHELVKEARKSETSGQHRQTKKSETSKPEKETKKSQTPKKKKKDVVVNRPPIIYHPPPEVYHRPEIVVHRAPVLIHRPPIVYHQPAVIVHRPPVVYHQSPVVFHQPAPTVNQPVLYSHDNFVVHPTMFASHAGTMVESAGHFLGLPSGPITNFPGPFPGFGGLQGLGMAPYATPFGRKRRSAKGNSGEEKESFQKREDNFRSEKEKESSEKESSDKDSHFKKADRKNAIVVHRPPVIYHPPPEIYHRPRVVVHRPDVLIHRPPIVVHQSPVVLHRPPVVYHQTPLIFHQPPPMINQPVYHSHDAYMPHPVFTHYDSQVHHMGSYQGIPPYGYGYHGFGGGYLGFGGGFPGMHGGFSGYPSLHGGIGGFHAGFGGFHGPFAPGFGRSKIEKPKHKKEIKTEKHGKKVKKHKKEKTHKKSTTKSERAKRKHSVMVHRPPVIFHPAPEVYHRPAFVIHQPDIVIHRPPTVYHQSPVVVHHPPIAYHQPPVVVHQPPPVMVQPTYHHHHFFHECSGHGCYGGAPHLYGGFGYGGCFGRCGGFGGFGHGCCGGFGGGFHGGYPFLYGKSSVPKHSRSKEHTTKHKHDTLESDESTNHHKNANVNSEQKTSSDNSKASMRHHEVKEKKGSKKNNIVIHRPPLVYHPPPEIYHRPDIIVHRPDVLVHRPSIVYDQPAMVLHRPAVIYHEPDVVFHQPPPLVNLPIYHASDMYAPHPVYTEAGSQVGFDHDILGVPPHFSYGEFGVSHAFGKSKIEGSKSKHEPKRDEEDSGDQKNRQKSEKEDDEENKYGVAEEKTTDHTKMKDNSAKSSEPKETGKKKHHSSNHLREKTKSTKAHKKYNLIMHRPPMVYHPSPTIYHRPDIVVHHPDIVIHRPSVVMQPPSVVVHKPAVVYRQPPVVFHQPEPSINQPIYNSHDAYEAHPVYTHVGSSFEHGGNYLAHPGFGADFGFQGYGDGRAFPGFGKSKIQKSKDTEIKEKDGIADKKADKHKKQESGKTKQDRKERDKSKDEKDHEHAKRDTHATNTKRVQLPHAQKEKTETGTKKNAIVVRRPPIIYHPPPEVYHRPDIVVHRAPIVIQRAPLVYHQSPVIVHRPAVVYHQPAVVFHQPAPAVHQPVFHSVDTFSVHPHLSFSQAGSSVHQVGEYLGVPQEVMHRSTVPTSTTEHKDTTNAHTDLPHPKQKRATLEQHITPITPLNYIHPRHPAFETLRSSIPYPTLHPHSLSYSSFPWGFPPKSKRSVAAHPYAHPELATMVPHELYPLPYPPFYHPSPLQRPHVNVNIETVKSKVPQGGNRERRQSMLDPSMQLPNSAPTQTEAMHYGHLASYPVLPRPHVNVNIETVKSSVPRSRRQVLAGLPSTETQPAFAPQTYSQTVVPAAPAQLPSPPEEQLGVYRDLLGAIYPRGVRRRPKVNIVVQTAKSTIPSVQNEKKSVLPGSLRKENVDAFNTMPEVTTIEPPLLRDGVRVNMVDLGDPTTEPSPSSSSNLAPNVQPSYSNMNMQNFGMSVMGLGAQGNYGMDKWKKFTVPKPSRLWHDVNAEKKSAVPGVHRQAPGKKRFLINELQSGIQSPGQLPEYQSGVEPQGSLPFARPAAAGYSPPSGYTTEPQVLGPQTDGVVDQGQSVSGNLLNQNNGFLQTGRPSVNVNVETYKKHTLVSNVLPSKRQIIGALPLTSLFRPNPNTAKASLKTLIPSTNTQRRNSPQFMTKRQQIMRRVPLAKAIPTVRHRVENARVSPESSTRGYAAFPVQDTQAHAPSTFPYQALQTATHPQFLTTPRPGSYVQQTVTEAPSSPTQPPSSYLSTLYPWGTRRHVNINIETAKSKIPSVSNGLSKSNKIITPRFKREFPVLYNIIKARAELDAAKKDGKGRRDKRQIPMFSGGFLQSLIPDANLLAKRAFYGSVPR